MVDQFLASGSKLADALTVLGGSADLTNVISIQTILVTLLTSAVCGAVIYLVYRFFNRSVIYNENFNILVILTTVVTSFIIMTISSNVVLSLGMVGALSIVRFRAAVKDPLYILITIFRKEKKSYLLILRYKAASEMNVTGILNGIKYRLKNKTQTGDQVELTIEVKIKKNDTAYLSRFNAVEGVESVTLLEYSGEYLS